MPTPVVLSAVRTPLGRFRGCLSSLSATDLGAMAISEAVQRAGIPGADVDEAIIGNVVSAGLGQAPARRAALVAGLPASVSAVTVNMVCGSGLKAVELAARSIRCGAAEVVAAGGMESMSGCPYLLDRDGPRLGPRELRDAMLVDGLECAFTGESMGVVAERLAGEEGIAREEQDRYAVESHRRAVAAWERGDFDEEVVPVPIGEETIRADEGPRADTSLEALAKLKSAFGGTVTAGNASMISDGAAAVVVASRDYCERTGREPIAEILGAASAPTEPADLFLAPVEAIRRAVARSERQLADIELLEINEAFAVQMLACLSRLEVDPARVNVNGGSIALGHPIGASGARILTTLLHALRRRGERLGVASACLGGGDAVALVVRAIGA